MEGSLVLNCGLDTLLLVHIIAYQKLARVLSLILAESKGL